MAGSRPTPPTRRGGRISRIVVEGTIVGADGCRTAEFEKLSQDFGTDRLTVSVGTATDPDPTQCQECLTAIDHALVVPFADELPSTVVEHEGLEDTETTILHWRPGS